jgi:hypothetical protein
MRGKAIKYNFVFCASGDAGETGTFGSVLNMKYLIEAVKFQWSVSYYFGPLIFCHSPMAP